jgi:large subunit ribosomal protein L35
MPKLKTHKATRKRLKLTKNNKIMQRTAGQDHFNARESGKITKKKRQDHKVSKANVKAINKLIRQG